MYFTYSALYGLGTCFIYNPCFLVIAKYFTEKLSVATGVVSLGASIGVLYTGPLLQVLLDSFEWRNTFRIMAATFVFVCILSLNFNPVENLNTENDSNEEVRHEKTSISLYCSVWSFPAYTVIVASLTFASFGWYIPYINLVCSIRISCYYKKYAEAQMFRNRPFVGSGHMVRNKLHWDANDAVGLPKQKNSYQSSATFLCFGSPTASFASQCNLFRTM